MTSETWRVRVAKFSDLEGETGNWRRAAEGSLGEGEEEVEFRRVERRNDDDDERRGDREEARCRSRVERQTLVKVERAEYFMVVCLVYVCLGLEWVVGDGVSGWGEGCEVSEWVLG